MYTSCVFKQAELATVYSHCHTVTDERNWIQPPEKDTLH